LKHIRGCNSPSLSWSFSGDLNKGLYKDPHPSLNILIVLFHPSSFLIEKKVRALPVRPMENKFAKHKNWYFYQIRSITGFMLSEGYLVIGQNSTQVTSLPLSHWLPKQVDWGWGSRKVSLKMISMLFHEVSE
jgi:hypothetical protein